jgi:hypothetical protein
MKSFCFLDNHTHSLWIWRVAWVALGNTYTHNTINFKFLFEMTKRTKKRKKKKKRIINAHYRHPQPDHSASSFFSLSLPLFSLVNHFLSLVQSHTHTIIICSRYARRALAPCSLFKFFLPFSLLLLSSDHSKKGEREREREEEKKSVCKLLKSFMNERIGAKKGKTRCSHIHTHTQSSFSLLFSLLFLFVAPVYFCHCLSW